MLMLLCCLPTLVLAINSKVTINIDILNSKYTASFDKFETATGAQLRGALEEATGTRNFALCRSDGHEIEDNKPLSEQGIEKALNNPFTFDQEYVVLLDTFSGVKQHVAACKQSTVKQILGRANMDLYPKGTTFRSENQDDEGSTVKENFFVDKNTLQLNKADDQIGIKAKPMLSGENGKKWMIWMPVKFSYHVSYLDEKGKSSVSSSLASVYKLIDNTTEKVDSTITDAEAPRIDSATILGRIPVSGPIKKPTDGNNMVKVENVSYGLIPVPSNSKPYLVALGDDEMKNAEKVVKSILRDFIVVKNFSKKWKFQNSPIPEMFTKEIKSIQNVIALRKDVQRQDLSQAMNNLNINLPQSNDRSLVEKNIRLQDSQKTKLELSPFKWIIIGTIVFAVVAAGFLAHIWLTQDNSDELLASIKAIEQDLQETENIQQLNFKQN